MTTPEPQPQPDLADVRFTDDGALEVFDGMEWKPYRPPVDGSYTSTLTIFRDGESRHPDHD